MELTEEEKIKIIETTASRLRLYLHEGWYYTSICSSLRSAFYNTINIVDFVDFEDVMKHFPEILNEMPKSTPLGFTLTRETACHAYWFNLDRKGLKQRIALLNRVLKDM